MEKIRFFKLSEEATSSIVIHPLDGINAIGKLKEPHRDDHYLLLIAFDGDYHLKIDFEDVVLKAPFALSIEPGQVHQVVKMEKELGWALGIEEFILEAEFLEFLESKLLYPIPITKGVVNINTVLTLTHQIRNDSNNIYSAKAILYLINAFFCLLFDETSNPSKTDDSKERRRYIIVQNFKRSIKKNFRDWKNPSQYASALAISTSHLNDTIKETTGFSVSYHIQQKNIIEAKRLLYFTDLDIQEIGFKLGYNDNVYFGKLFKKVCGMSPLAFRKQFRD